MTLNRRAALGWLAWPPAAALAGCAGRIRGPGAPLDHTDDRAHGIGQPGGAAAAWPVPPDIVVAADGSGQFRSLHQALQAIPRDNRERLLVRVKAGDYAERVRLDAPFVTVRGDGRDQTRLRFAHPASAPADDLGRAVFNIGPGAHDLVLEGLHIENTHGVLGEHAFAILGRADRSVVQDCRVHSLGNDTLAMWRGAPAAGDAAFSALPGVRPLAAHGGRYFHTRLDLHGSVDFVCPRGWCHLADSTLRQVNPATTAAVWHDGRGDARKKFVLQRCRFDGPPEFYLARRHHDGQFYFIDCRFSERLRDQPPYRVVYPAGSAAALAADPAHHRFGDRHYFHGNRRDGGNPAWMADNLASAPGAPRPQDMGARWTFDDSWDPERRDGPQLTGLQLAGDRLALRFSEAVSAKGAAQLRLPDGRLAELLSGSGGPELTWQITGKAPADVGAALGGTGAAPPRTLRLQRGALVANEAATALRHAMLTRPG